MKSLLLKTGCNGPDKRLTDDLIIGYMLVFPIFFFPLLRIYEETFHLEMDLGKLNDHLLFDKGYLSDQYREEIDLSSPIIHSFACG